MRVIFLDIDGVLIPYNGPARTLNVECVKVLQDILAASGAFLVISSSWRISEYNRLLTMLKPFGLYERVIGKTPLANEVTPNTLYNDVVSSTRPLEIRAWLTKHPFVTEYLVIDDEFMIGMPQILTRSSEGLIPVHVAHAPQLFSTPA